MYSSKLKCSKNIFYFRGTFALNLEVCGSMRKYAEVAEVCGSLSLPVTAQTIFYFYISFFMEFDYHLLAQISIRMLPHTSSYHRILLNQWLPHILPPQFFPKLSLQVVAPNYQVAPHYR